MAHLQSVANMRQQPLVPQTHTALLCLPSSIVSGKRTLQLLVDTRNAGATAETPEAATRPRGHLGVSRNQCVVGRGNNSRDRPAVQVAFSLDFLSFALDATRGTYVP